MLEPGLPIWEVAALGTKTFQVYWALCESAEADAVSLTRWPAATLAERLGISRNTVKSAINRLVDGGFIVPVGLARPLAAEASHIAPIKSSAHGLDACRDHP